jgi:hypothetical protein
MGERLEARHGGSRFVIEHDSAVGWYLHVYKGEECTKDYLQDTAELALEQAEDEFGVPRSAWSVTAD